MNPPTLAKLIAVAVLVFILVVLASTTSYVVEPGTRGIKVTLGKVADGFLPEGFGFKTPLITRIVPVSVKQRTSALNAECFSSDLQQVIIDVRVLYRVPESSVVQIYREFAGDPFDSLIAPRVQEALKEVTASKSAVKIVTDREDIKQKAIATARQKIGSILTVEDIVIRSIDLSHELEVAIEAKMVAEQEATKSRFVQLQTQVEADTVVIRARGEAEAIRIRGEALTLNPAFLRLQIVEKWNGRSPLVIPGWAQFSGGPVITAWTRSLRYTMTPRGRTFLQLAILVVAIGGLILIFPRALAFTEMAARELRYFWWLILLLALAAWLIWGFKKRP